MALVGVELETLVSESHALTTRSAKFANIYSAAATSARNVFHYSCCLRS